MEHMVWRVLYAIGAWQETCPCTCDSCQQLREFYSRNAVTSNLPITTDLALEVAARLRGTELQFWKRVLAVAALATPSPLHAPAGDLESLAATFHAIYQSEARRQGNVRHKDAYADLPENIKEFDRVLARYVLLNFEVSRIAPAATQEPAGSGGGELKVGDPVRVSGILEAISSDGTLIKVNFGMGEYCHPNRLLVHPAPGSPRKVGEDGDSHLSGRIAARLDEYKFVAQMISGVEEEGWYKRRVANLESMYAASSVPVGEQKQEESRG